MQLFQPAYLRIEHRAKDSEMVHRLRAKFPDIPVEFIAYWQEERGRGFSMNQRMVHEKKGLLLAVKEGARVKQVDRDLFRETPNEYYIIHAMGCPFDCEYCFLFDYLDHQIPTIFVNLEDILAETEETIRRAPAGSGELLFHAGEFSDALAFDHLTNLSAPLVTLFAGHQNARLELRTKSDNIANLLALPHNGRTTISWTFSPEITCRRNEHRTATLAARIAAARACQKAGYPVALRIDPIVYFEDWEAGYAAMVKAIMSRLDPAGIQDCSLGFYRATPGLNRIVRQRFPRSRLHLGELEQAADGKYRYIRPLRLRMLKHIVAQLRQWAPEVKIDLCMESPEVMREMAPRLLPVK